MIKTIFDTSLSHTALWAQGLEYFAQLDADSMAGWRRQAQTNRAQELKTIEELAEVTRLKSDILVCIGIGGSYLGHRSVIEALAPSSQTQILYAGNSLSALALEQVLESLQGKDFSLNVISKSGNTLEPDLAFTVLKAALVEKYGEEEAYKRIVATTDVKTGKLRAEASQNGYACLDIPDDVGGRYSVFTPVGLFPLAVAGVDIEAFCAGARASLINDKNIVKYAVARQWLHQNGALIEVLASFEPHLFYLHEWWKQLFGESEGKDHKGIFPASLIYSTDLHSLGQYMQDGARILFETFLEFERPAKVSPALQSLQDLNQIALTATKTAHAKGGLPVLELQVPTLDAKNLGEMMMFFMQACAISAKLSGVNPYDQNGVEAYKNEIKKLR